MSDSASSPSSDDANPASNPPSSSAELAFVVHSQDTVQQNLPPDVDNKSLARQKRRRTSPEDFRVLEAAYQENPKPDKAARLEIVSKVALGEKEVQIWFQNRRQNDRRRSRPLQTHEILSHLQRNKEEVTFETGPPAVAPETKSGLVVAARGSDFTVLVDSENGRMTVHDLRNKASASAEDSQDSQATTAANASIATDQPTSDTQPTELDSSQTQACSQDEAQSSATVLDRPTTRGSAETITIYDEEAEAAKQEKEDRDKDRARRLKRTSSGVRLAMTSDGKARLLEEGESSPSPPRPEPFIEPFSHHTSLRRSASSAGLDERLREAASEMAPRKLQRTASGRSRDSRTWEFWCDAEARNSLSEKANQEGSGSAADAIGLMKANRRQALTPLPGRRNIQLQRQSSAKPLKTGQAEKDKRPFGRASSSFGRLQTDKEEVQKHKKNDKKEDVEDSQLPGNDSDKENWEPNTAEIRHRRPQATQEGSKAGRKVLGENSTIMSQSNSLGSMMDKETRRTGWKAINKSDAENARPEDDEEVAEFVGTRSNSGTSMSSGEDLDCVQGLLQLSRGNWK